MVLATAAPHLQERAAPPPRLVVIVVVDQMRADYLERYGPLFSKGLRRLSAEGAWFTNAAYPYLNTVTCVGHSTIGTGTFPYHHGMILNGWLDRATGTVPGCTEDATATETTYAGLKPATADSARNLMRPALGEQVRDKGHGRATQLDREHGVPCPGPAVDLDLRADGWPGGATRSRLAAERQRGRGDGARARARRP